MEKIHFSERDGGSKVKFATYISVYPQLHYKLAKVKRHSPMIQKIYNVYIFEHLNSDSMICAVIFLENNCYGFQDKEKK